jgi:hypothetical protein
MSIHLWKSHTLAQKKGAWFGALRIEHAERLGKMSKRELIEIALHLASLNSDDPNSPEHAYHRVMDECFNLKANGLT